MTVPWPQIQSLQSALLRAAEANEDLTPLWSRFAATAAESAAAPPYHLATLLALLARIDIPRSRIRILEHGCGGGSALFYLLALGYGGVQGIDIGGPSAALNRIAAAAGLPGERFFVYDGNRLPFADSSFDFVFSQQVLEHVAPDVVGAYYDEEMRVLAAGGTAYHQVPHRLVPYESHTRTWFVHYLPRPAAQWMYRRLGRETILTRQHLFLRTPAFHRRQLRRRLGHCEDWTIHRLRHLVVEGYYDGPFRLRRLIAALVRMPGLGAIFALLLRNFVMIETVSVKRRRGIGASSGGTAA